MPDLIRLDLSPSMVEAALPGRRQIIGRAVPFGEVATVSTGQRVRFLAGGLVPPADLSHSPMLVDHQGHDPVGHLSTWAEVAQGVDATWQLGSSVQASAALADALEGVRTGLSVGVEPLEGHPGPDADGVLTFSAEHPAAWVETSLLTVPAFTAARVAQVAAARELARPPAPIPSTTTTTTPPSQENTAMPDTAAPAAPVLAAGAPPDGQAAETPTVAAAAGGHTITGVRESYPYTFQGHGPSMLRDHVNAGSDPDARARLNLAAAMLADPSGMVQAAAGDGSIGGTPGIALPINRPDLWLAQIVKDSPILGACSRPGLAAPNPFSYPRTISTAGLVIDPAAEGATITPGSIVTDSVTLTPVLMNGAYRFTRSLLDSSSPSIDVIAAEAIREALQEKIEIKISTALALAGDFTPQTAVVAAGDGLAYTKSLRKALGSWYPRRFAAPTAVLASSADYGLAITADGTDGRPIFPPEAPSNAPGAAQNAGAALSFYGLQQGVQPAWALAPDTTHMIRGADVDVFISPVQSFRFEEKAGPELIEVAARLYMVAKVRRVEGNVKLVHTLTTADEAKVQKAMEKDDREARQAALDAAVAAGTAVVE